MKRAFIIGLALLFSVALSRAQSNKSALYSKAENEYQSLRYISAVPLLKRALKHDPKNAAIKEMLANSYRNLKNYNQALYWYGQLTEEAKLKPLNVLHYAEALANLQQYDKAGEWYRKYQEITFNQNLGDNFAKAYQNISQLKKNHPEWTVSYTNLNTAAAEYSPAYFKTGLIFSSNRPSEFLSRKVFGWDGTPFSDLYIVTDLKQIKRVDPDSILNAVKKNPAAFKKYLYKVNDDDTYQTSNDSRTLANYNPLILKDTLGNILSAAIEVSSAPGKINSAYHEAAPVLCPDGTLYFTRNNYYKKHSGESKTGINKLQIFSVNAPDFDKVVPFEFNNPEYSVGHPTISKDGKLLIFTSDMPAGYGGTDLYYCTRNSNQTHWSKPINMGGQINTAGNEMFPFLDSKGRLVFSSTGHPGLGGLDLFYIDLNGVEPRGIAANFGAPVNSSLDDFAAIFSEDRKTGFFSSNRRGNDDIYTFEYHPYQIVLKAKVLDAKSRLPIVNSTVYFKSSDGNDTLLTDASGTFTRSLEKDAKYSITIKKDGFSNSEAAISSQGIQKDSILTATFVLNQLPPKRQEVIVNCDSIRKAFEVHNIYYDLNKADIRPDAIPGLNHVVELLHEHPEISVIAASHCDSRADAAYNIKLSLRRSNAVRNYLLSKGIDPRRIKAQYYGKSRLAVEGDENAEEIQKLNRRTEFFVIANGVNVTLKGCLK